MAILGAARIEYAIEGMIYTDGEFTMQFYVETADGLHRGHAQYRSTTTSGLNDSALAAFLKQWMADNWGVIFGANDNIILLGVAVRII